MKVWETKFQGVMKHQDKSFVISREMGLYLIPSSALMAELPGELRSAVKLLPLVITKSLATSRAQFSLVLNRTTVVWRWYREGQSHPTSMAALPHHHPQPKYGSDRSLNIYMLHFSLILPFACYSRESKHYDLCSKTERTLFDFHSENCLLCWLSLFSPSLHIPCTQL